MSTAVRLDRYPNQALFAISVFAVNQNNFDNNAVMGSPIPDTYLVTRDSLISFAERDDFNVLSAEQSDYEGIYFANIVSQEANVRQTVPPAPPTPSVPRAPAPTPQFENDMAGSGQEVESEGEETNQDDDMAATIKHKKVTFSKWFHSEPADPFAEYMEEVLLPHVGQRSIRFSSHPQGEILRLRQDERYFHVYMGGSTIRGRNQRTLQETAWGVTNRQRALGRIGVEPTVTAIETPEGDIIAGVSNDMLFIYPNVGGMANGDEFRIFKKIIDITAHFLEHNEIPINQMDKEELEELYVNACKRRSGDEIARLERELKSKRSRYERASKEVVKMVREITQKEEQYEKLKNSDDDGTGKYRREFQALLDNRHVEALMIRDEVLHVHTDNIQIKTDLPDNLSRTGEKEKDVTFNIGKFDISIPLNGGSVSFRNKTRTIRTGFGLHHPHIDASGNPCLGTASESIPQLIAQFEFAAVAQLCIAYLQHVNLADSAGSGITSWPRAGDAEDNSGPPLPAAEVDDPSDYDDEDFYDDDF